MGLSLTQTLLFSTHYVHPPRSAHLFFDGSRAHAKVTVVLDSAGRDARALVSEHNFADVAIYYVDGLLAERFADVSIYIDGVLAVHDFADVADVASLATCIEGVLDAHDSADWDAPALEAALADDADDSTGTDDFANRNTLAIIHA